MAVSTAPASWTSNFTALPPDPIMGARSEFMADLRPHKINAGIGMIIDPNTGKPFVPPTAHRIAQDIGFSNVGYLSSAGNRQYLHTHGRELVFGRSLWRSFFSGSVADKPSGMVWAQTIGGTKALSLAARLIVSAIDPSCRSILIDPGWPNHPHIFSDLTVINYTHINPVTHQYNHDGFVHRLNELPHGCSVLMQVCGYNDDGADRSPEQWDEIIGIVKKRKLLPILDFAYNGLAEGWGVDNYAVKAFTESEQPTIICVSNSKNLGYNLRLGSLYIVNVPKTHADRMQQNLENRLIRPDYSNPNALPAQVMATMLEDDILRKQYMAEIDAIRTDLIDHNRMMLADVLGPEYSWIKDRRGIFLRLAEGFTDKQHDFLKDKNAIHGPKSSRINVGGIPPDQMPRVAELYKQALAMTS